MIAPLPATGLWIPPRPPGLIARLRLADRLDEIVDRRLALVSAPAGYGKTTLLSDWASRCRWPVAWLSLDERDNDVHRFLAHVVAAWAAVEPSVREGRLGTLVGSLMPPVDRVLAALADEAGKLSEHVVFILDDYHVVEEPSVHDALTTLLDHLPPPMHFVLASRADPPLPLARLRGRGQLVELRAADLRFTVGEAAEFLRHAMGIDLPDGDVAALDTRIEGWIAGLQMAALSLRGRRDLPEHLTQVAGDDRYIADYLAGEVLSRQPDDARSFLLQTAILDRLSGPLCDSVTGRKDGQQMLESLDRSNLFLVPLDNRRQWYRYHHLFAEFLRHRLDQVMADGVADLHRRASDWHAANDAPDLAFRHAVAGQDFQHAARIVEEQFLSKMAYGQYRIVADWLQALPADLFISRPLLGLYRVVFLLSIGQLEAGARCLDDLDRQIQAMATVDTGEADAHLARVAAARVVLACHRDDLRTAIAFSGQALHGLPEDDLFYRFAVQIALGDTYRRAGRWDAAREPYLEALAVARRAPSPFKVIAIHPLSALGDHAVMRGRLRRAADFRRECLQLIAEQTDRAVLALPIVGWAHIRMGELLYEWNDLVGALDHLRKGLDLAQLGGETRALVAGYLAIGQAELARGGLDGAAAHLRRAKPIVESAEVPDWTSQLNRLQVRLWLAQGNLRAAGDWVEETRFRVDDETSYHYELGRLALARVLIAQGATDAGALDRALVLLDRLLRSAEGAGRMGVVVEVQALRALALRGQGRIAQAMIALEQALRLAEPEGFVRLFVDLGPPMAALLHEAGARGVLTAYAGALLAAFGEGFPAAGASAAGSPDRLSERELEVLRLLAAGLSNHEIADELVIAVGTVKRHTATIYEKLGVNSRTRAIARARALSLLV
ncbi:MAG: tetratricopeptide repeat protein [Chloroflexi bacterium]|nr:tetratricopeptide repeat protein [Chloroflexota bacterium]